MITSHNEIKRWTAGTLILFVAQLAFAGPGFIGSSKVSEVASGTEIRIRFNCKAQYLRHEPQSHGDRLRIYLDPTSICNGVSPTVADTRSRLRPYDADSARLDEIEYEGGSSTGSVLTLSFSEPVSFSIDASKIAFELVVHVDPSGVSSEAVVNTASVPTVTHRQILQPKVASPDWVVNLASFRRIPTIADAPNLHLEPDQRLYYYKVIVDGVAWYRLRLGDFESGDSAYRALVSLEPVFPGAWIDQIESGDDATELTPVAQESPPQAIDQADADDPATSKIDSLMEDARKAIIGGDSSRAIQIYTKILQLPKHPRHPEAQEYLALAREKKGQTAHAKAEYQRYLSLYPDSEGVARVKQRLAALLASNRKTGPASVSTSSPANSRAAKQSDWRFRSYFSQYYRRYVNQQNDQSEIVSQSALYSDVNFDVIRRGERFDFNSRISAGYRSDFLDEDHSSQNALRVSYAYANLADAVTGLRARIGRQSRNTGGVLGRFDGLDLGFEPSEQFLISAVAGKPAYSSSNGIDSARSFYGASVNYRPPLDGMELGVFFIQQNIEGLTDRQAVGGEFRYFGEKQSLWGLLDYDTSYDELGSAFLQGSLRFASRLALHGSFDRRHSPFLSAGNALIGQPVLEFSELLGLYPQQEIRQFGLDRSPVSTTYTLGLSHSLSPKLQINADVSQSEIEGTPASGGVLATPGANYNYYSASMVASSLWKEGDVTIITARYSDSGTSRVISLTLDSRYPFGRTWRVNPRLRVDRRQRLTNSSYEWLYTPGIRVQYRRSQRFRIEFEAGKQYSKQEWLGTDLDRESYFINLGYQAFF